MIDIVFGDDVVYYYKGRKIPTVALYITPTIHYIHHVAPYVAKRLLEVGISHFRYPDPTAAYVIELACGGRCTHDPHGVSIDYILEEAYYNYLADKILAHTATADALVVPCVDQPLARALSRRAREYAPDLLQIASQYGGTCQLDVQHDPKPVEVPLPLGPASRAALHTAAWAIEERIAEAPLTPLLDIECSR
ncbi:MAG: hypothetical protein ACK4SY_08635 [Pyrobaculum sp.]